MSKLAYMISERNLDHITQMNDGVAPEIKAEVRYFVFDLYGDNYIITENELWSNYTIRQNVRAEHDYYVIED